MSRTRAAGVGVALFVLAGCAPSPHAEQQVESTAILDAALPDIDAPGCSAAVGLEGEVVWAGARGLANAETGARLETSTRMDLASTSKQFTAMAVLMLVERGELSLDDVLSQRLDGMPGWADDLTLRDLMHHTAGLSDFTASAVPTDSGIVTSADVLDWVRTRAWARGVGSFAYSSTNYNLLAAVVAEETGTEFGVWVQAEVFGPLALDAHFWPLQEADAVGHHAQGDDGFGVVPSAWADEGSGGILMSPSDLVRWADQLREPSVLSAERLDSALADAVRVDADARYGPGLILFPDGSIGHGGDGDGGNSAFVVSPDRRTAVSVMCNRDGLSVDSLEEQLTAVWFDR